MRFAHLYQKLYCEPLMLSQEAFTAFDHVLSAHISAGPAAVVRQVNPATTDAPLGDSLDFYRRARATAEQIRVEEVLRKYGPVAVVQVHGAIDRNLSRMEIDCYGACDLQDINAALADCDADDAIETVILDFDTPGGTCVGHAETADMIFGMRARKNMVAWVGGQCCSLGVYLASQCETVILGTSAWFGSIGVRCARLDATANLKAQGLQVTLIASSDAKTDGSPAKPFTEAERQRMQARCDMLQADFMARVRAGRPGVSDDVMRAQVFFGRDAVAVGLADAVAPSLDVVAADLLAVSQVTANNPSGGSGMYFDGRNAARLDGGTSFEGMSAPFQAGTGNPNHDSAGRFASAPDTSGGTGGSSSIRKVVSELHALHSGLSDNQRAVVAHTQAAIDKVHGIPKGQRFFETTIRSNPRLVGAKAAYQKGPYTGDIHMKPGVTNEADLLEEIGHHLDHQVGGLDFASKTGADFKEINQAIEKSAPVKQLNSMARGAKGQSNENATHLRRVARPEEKFARAYAQYIAAKSGDEKIQKQVANDRASRYYGKQKYWSEEEFAPIMKAFDNHLEKNKWK